MTVFINDSVCAVGGDVPCLRRGFSSIYEAGAAEEPHIPQVSAAIPVGCGKSTRSINKAVGFLLFSLGSGGFKFTMATITVGTGSN